MGEGGKGRKIGEEERVKQKTIDGKRPAQMQRGNGKRKRPKERGWRKGQKGRV